MCPRVGTCAPAVIITRAWADETTGIPLMMTAAEASPLYLEPAGAAAEGVYVQGAMGVVGDRLPTTNPFRASIDEFAGPFQSLCYFHHNRHKQSQEAAILKGTGGGPKV